MELLALGCSVKVGLKLWRSDSNGEFEGSELGDALGPAHEECLLKAPIWLFPGLGRGFKVHFSHGRDTSECGDRWAHVSGLEGAGVSPSFP